MSNATEADLIARAKQGDGQAFNKLMGPHQTQLLREITRVLHDADDAHDVRQKVLMKVWQGLKTFRGDSAFHTWLFAIVRNAVRDHLRERKRDPLHNASDDEIEAIADALEPETPEPDESLRLIKEAHRTGGRKLTLKETLEFIERPVWMGEPEPLPRRGTRGPLPRGTQYDEHAKRQHRLAKWARGIVHRHVLLPAAGAAARRKKPKQ